jgi:acetylglutamate synthase
MTAHTSTTTHELRPVIVRLLSNMASAKEIQQYLKRFSQLDAARFAVVKVGGAVLSEDLENLVSSLAFLQQVGLTPIVVHGAGPQLNEELAREGHHHADRGRAALSRRRPRLRSCVACSSRKT